MSGSDSKFCAILLGMAATKEAAGELNRLSSTCPYVANTCTNGPLTTGVYVLPEEKRWWIEIPAQQPHLLGLDKAWLVYANCPEASSPWSRGEVMAEMEETPCKSDCSSCPHYETKCSGCPAWRSSKI